MTADEWKRVELRLHMQWPGWTHQVEAMTALAMRCIASEKSAGIDIEDMNYAIVILAETYGDEIRIPTPRKFYELAAENYKTRHPYELPGDPKPPPLKQGAMAKWATEYRKAVEREHLALYDLEKRAISKLFDSRKELAYWRNRYGLLLDCPKECTSISDYQVSRGYCEKAFALLGATSSGEIEKPKTRNAEAKAFEDYINEGQDEEDEIPFSPGKDG